MSLVFVGHPGYFLGFLDIPPATIGGQQAGAGAGVLHLRCCLAERKRRDYEYL